MACRAAISASATFSASVRARAAAGRVNATADALLRDRASLHADMGALAEREAAGQKHHVASLRFRTRFSVRSRVNAGTKVEMSPPSVAISFTKREEMN